MTVIGEKRESAVSTAAGFFVKTGARDENKVLSGVSHFLEHMMFKGTAKRSALDITYELGAIGAQANAYTSEETTVFYLAVLPEYFPKAFDILSDMLRPSLDANEFVVEKKVILEEIALYQDKPTHYLFETSLREFFGSHPAGNCVLGTAESIGALTSEQMRGYFDLRYSASNIVLAVAGQFDWEEVVAYAEQHCGHWSNHPAQRVHQVHQPVPGQKLITKAELQRAHLCLLAPGPAATSTDRYPAEILSAILGDSSGSRAYWALIDKGLADSAVVDVDDMDEVGLIYGYVSSTPEQLDEVGEILAGIMSTPENFSQHELDRAVTKIGTRLVLQGESSMRRLMAIGNDWLYRSEYVPLQEELSRIQNVTRDTILDLTTRYSFMPTNVVKLLPE